MLCAFALEKELMARIFLAATNQGISCLERILGTGHEFTTASTMEEAVCKLWQEPFDLIVVGLHFDESRMFELLPLTKTHKNAETPIICFCMRDTAITRIMHRSIELTSKVFGAWMYIDQHEYTDRENPDAEIRRVIERCLTDEARKHNLEQRIDIAAQRDELMRLRLTLEAEQWSPELQHELSLMRHKLSRVLLELTNVNGHNVTQQQQIRISQAFKDRVSEAVDLAEDGLSVKEATQALAESRQSRCEQAMIDQEEKSRNEAQLRLTNEAASSPALPVAPLD